MSISATRSPPDADDDIPAAEAAFQGLDDLVPPSPPDGPYWRQVRLQFDLKPSYTFLNHGTLGPTPRVVTDIYHRQIDALAQDPGSNFFAWKQGLDSVRDRLARFVNAEVDSLTLTRSTTEGMNIFAHGLDWQPGDEVIINTHEHFGGRQAYETLQERRGIRIVEVQIPAPSVTGDQIVAAYRNAVTARTRLIVVSHVSYVTGLLMPIRELADLAHRHGLLISVDGAQSVGVVPLDLQASDVDHYAGSGQKWLLAGTGTGFSYIRKELQPRVWPLTGHHSLSEPAGPYASPRYERTGQKNMPSLFAIGAAVDLQATIGAEAILQRVRQLAARLRDGLREIPGVVLWTPGDPAQTAGLTTFTTGDRRPEDIVTALRETHRIIVRPIVQADVNAVRASTHFFNTESEVDDLLAAVRSLIGAAVPSGA